MAMPTDVPIIDSMIGFPIEDKKKLYEFITKQTKDAQSKDEYEFPVEYMFKDVPDKSTSGEDPVAVTLARDGQARHRARPDRHRRAATPSRALKEHPDRFVAALSVDPNDIMGDARPASSRRTRSGTSAPSTCSRAGSFPQVAHQRHADVPGLRQVRGARHPRVRQRRRRRARG